MHIDPQQHARSHTQPAQAQLECRGSDHLLTGSIEVCRLNRLLTQALAYEQHCQGTMTLEQLT